MLINFKHKIRDLDGKPFKQGEDGGGEMTLGQVAEIALTMPTEKNKDLTGDKKVHRSVMAHDIHRNGEVDISLEDRTMLREAIAGLGYNFLIVGACWDLLDPKVKEVKTGKK